MSPTEKREVLDHLHTEIAAIKEPPKPRWRCCECKSTNVQVDMRAWFKETTDFNLTFVEVGECSSIQAWYCEDCGESEAGEPEEATAEDWDPGQTCPCDGHEWNMSAGEADENNLSGEGDQVIRCVKCGANGDV